MSLVPTMMVVPLWPVHGPPRPSAARCCRWSRDADGPAANRRRARALLRIRPCWRPDRIAALKSAAAKPRTDTALILRPGILRKFAAFDRGRRHRAGGFRLRRKGIGEWILREAASTCRRCSRQNQTTSAPAPQTAVSGASKATRRHGAWLLTRTQQITVLSKHVPSKQPLKLRIRRSANQDPLAGNLRPDPAQLLQFPGNAWQRRHETHIDQRLAIETGVGPDDADQGWVP